MSLTNLAGRVAVITGGASGIGRGIAEVLIARGTKVVIADIQADALGKTAAEIGATAIQVDVTNPDSVGTLAHDVQARFGRVDIVCNNAGVGSIGRTADLTISDWQWVLNVNLFGVVYGVQHFLPLLQANPEGGFFLNTTSIAGFATMPGFGPYSASKFGVVGLTECLALEMAEAGSKVGAGLLIPGPVRTNIAMSKRNRPEAMGETGLIDVPLDDIADAFGGSVPWIDALEAGEIAVRAIETGALYTTTHPALFSQVAGRHAAIEASYAS